VTITQPRYTHVDRDHLRLAAEQFGAHIEAAGRKSPKAPNIL
jgi:hypothetical protein